jgi:hypothetical protein
MEGRIKTYSIEITPQEKAVILEALSQFIKKDFPKSMSIMKDYQEEAMRIIKDLIDINF